MDEGERAVLKALGDAVVIYRGYDHRNGAKGLSWTLSRPQAEWFANRWGRRTAMVATGSVEQRHILAHFRGRNEDEIVVDPGHVVIVGKENVTAAIENVGKTDDAASER
jgi:hypothetical protein